MSADPFSSIYLNRQKEGAGSQMALLEVKNAGFSYESQAIFQDINFAVKPGEVFCLFGPNGCGKTTLLECLLGGLKLSQGSVLLNNRNLASLRPNEIAKIMAYVPQDHLKSFPYTVEEVVLMGRSSYIGFFSSPCPDDYNYVDQALELVGLRKLKDRPYTQISGGEVQLVMLARALAQQSPLIIMDEPTCHLDFRHEIAMLETMVRLVREMGLAIIMATHSPNHAFYFENNAIPTRVALMNDQKFSITGTPSAILTEKNLMALYQVVAKIISYSSDSGEPLKQVMPISTLHV